jgi:hypothetical protein
MKASVLFFIIIPISIRIFAQQPEKPEKIPFDGIDQTWQNGNDRRDSSVFKNGDSVHGPAQYFLIGMFYNRLWFYKNKFAWTTGGGIMTNPGRYLVLYPTGQASPLPDPNNPAKTEGTLPFSANPGDQFVGWDCSTNLDFMPNHCITFRVEFVHRESSVPYFAGAGGVNSQTGYSTSTLDPNWRPDLVKSESRIILAILFRK